MDWEKKLYLKDEGSNLNAKTTTLKSMMKCGYRFK
jgi:hypothetical protein